VAQVAYYGRDYDLAIELLGKTLALDQEFGHAHRLLGDALRKKGRFEEAVAAMRKALALSGGSRAFYLAQLGNASAAAGRKKEARAVLDELSALARTSYVSPACFMIVYSGLGDTEQALAWLERAHQERSGLITEMLLEPLFDGLRENRRFESLVRSMAFPR
jgi:tetratricopeptide (TPR) repeat protein